MDLNVPAAQASPASAGLQDPPARHTGKTLHDHPPQAWAEALLRKYGPMPISDRRVAGSRRALCRLYTYSIDPAGIKEKIAAGERGSCRVPLRDTSHR